MQPQDLNRFTLKSKLQEECSKHLNQIILPPNLLTSKSDTLTITLVSPQLIWIPVRWLLTQIVLTVALLSEKPTKLILKMNLLLILLMKITPKLKVKMIMVMEVILLQAEFPSGSGSSQLSLVQSSSWLSVVLSLEKWLIIMILIWTWMKCPTHDHDILRF